MKSTPARNYQDVSCNYIQQWFFINIYGAIYKNIGNYPTGRLTKRFLGIGSAGEYAAKIMSRLSLNDHYATLGRKLGAIRPRERLIYEYALKGCATNCSLISHRYGCR
jgi:hypothetical protein